eukprot:SAG25_NODE_2216_length_1829_cov_1.345665_2_plen_133_part_00
MRADETPTPQKLGRFPGLATGQRFAKFFHWRDMLSTGKRGKRTAFQVLADPPANLQATLATMQPGPVRDQTLLKFVREQSSAFSVTQFPAHVAKRKSLAVMLVVVEWSIWKKISVEEKTAWHFQSRKSNMRI